MLKRFRIALSGGLIQSRIHIPQIVWSDLVDVIVKPVCKQQISMAAPGGSRFVLRIVLREIIIRDVRTQAGFHIAEIFAGQSVGIVFRVAGHKGNSLIFAGKQVGITLFRFCQDL